MYLIAILQDKESWDINNAEKIEAAGKKKEEGNVLFKLGKYERASKRYEKVINTTQFCSIEVRFFDIYV